MSKSSISKSVIYQLIGKFLLQGIAFITTPIFTRLLTPADFGYTSLYMSWSSIFRLVIGLQTYGSIQNALSKFEKEEMPKYYSSIMTISFISFIVVLFLSVILNSFFADLLSLRNDLVLLVVLHSFAAYLITFQVSIYDANKNVEKSTMLSTFQTVIAVVVSFLFVISAKQDKAIWKIYGQAIPIVLIGMIIMISVFVKGRCFWNPKYNRFCIQFSIPLILHGLGHLVFTQSDRIMLTKMQSESVLGVYSVTFSLCSVLSIICAALNTSWVPFYYDYKKMNQEEEIIVHTKRYMKFFTILCMGFCLLSYDVYKLMAPKEYYDGMKIIPFFVISLYFNFLYLFPVNYEFFHCKTKLIPVGTIIAAIINIVINYLLIGKYSYVGAAIGTMVAHIILFIFHWIIARVLIREKFEYRIIQFLLYGIGFSIFAIAVIFLQNLIFIRWGIAVALGIYLIYDFIKRKSIF